MTPDLKISVKDHHSISHKPSSRNQRKTVMVSSSTTILADTDGAVSTSFILQLGQDTDALQASEHAKCQMAGCDPDGLMPLLHRS